jgi:hypothetical protein
MGGCILVRRTGLHRSAPVLGWRHDGARHCSLPAAAPPGRRVAFLMSGIPRPAGSKRPFVIAPKDPSKKPRAVVTDFRRRIEVTSLA